MLGGFESEGLVLLSEIRTQDPDPAVHLTLPPEHMKKAEDSVLAGGALIAGAAVGAAIGAVVSGPVGVVVGIGLGASFGAVVRQAMLNRI